MLCPNQVTLQEERHNAKSPGSKGTKKEKAQLRDPEAQSHRERIITKTVGVVVARYVLPGLPHSCRHRRVANMLRPDQVLTVSSIPSYEQVRS